MNVFLRQGLDFTDPSRWLSDKTLRETLKQEGKASASVLVQYTCDAVPIDLLQW